MEWMNAVGEFFNTPFGKTLIAVVGAAASFPAGLKAGSWWSKKKNLALQKEVKKAEAQADISHDNYERQKADNGQLRQEAKLREQKLTAVEKQLADEKDRGELVRKKGAQYYHAYNALKPKFDQTVKELQAEKALVAKLSSDLGGAGDKLLQYEEELARRKAELDHRQAELDRVAKRVKSALRLEGNLWAAKALQKVTKFRPLSRRNAAIISVLNLKGGVGKTTVTAHLGLSLARRGYRVLAVDLDLQGSLSKVFLSTEKLMQLNADKSLIHHFLTAASANPSAKMLDCAQDVFDFPESGGRLGIVAASDNLAYTELSLTLGWLLRRGERDNRFLLRKALQLMGVRDKYDVILLDCPPLMTISCINALAASDYVLIPATLSRQATERVLVLFRRFMKDPRFQKYINHDLRVLGLVANRTHREELTAAERDEWEQLGVWCKDAFGSDVKRFATHIPQLVREVRDAEQMQEPPPADSRLAIAFDSLATEIEQELPSECRRGTAALS